MSDIPTEEQLAEIEARVEAATRGPWKTDKWSSGAYIVGEVPGGRPSGEVIGDTRPTVDALTRKGYPVSAQHANAEFIAHSRQDVDALIRAVRVQRAEIAELRRVLTPTDEDRAELGSLIALAQSAGEIEGVDYLTPLMAVLSERQGQRARIERLTSEVDEQHQLIWKQAGLLTGAINAARGEPDELTLWSHHDVVEWVTKLRDERDAKAAVITRVRELCEQAMAECESAAPRSDEAKAVARLAALVNAARVLALLDSPNTEERSDG